jgi:SWI/SNF-related matrix-associated actin-dependent regulator of chromatin subfamily A3
LISKTHEASEAWALEYSGFPDGPGASKRPSRATLVLVSSFLLLNHWLAEIRRHLHKSIRVVKYHGQRRERQAVKIANADIVITTYHTLAAEMADPVQFGGESAVDSINQASPLSEIAWFRLVLDEAHTIRHRDTTFYKTCTQLHAANRWCLTGTPIQNTLDDIGGLFAFVRARPFDNISTFRSMITLPFEDKGERRRMACERLAMLLDSLCLRRTRNVVHLPDQFEVVRRLNFSPEEQQQYHQTNEMMTRAIKQGYGGSESKHGFGLFQASLQLRLLSNHGTYQNPFSWTNHRNVIAERENAPDMLGHTREVFCACCRQPLPIGVIDATYSQSSSCRHVCCLECLEQRVEGGEFDSAIQLGSCPVCESKDMSFRVKRKQDAASGVLPSSDYFRQQGYSTKIQALISDIFVGMMESKR